MEVETVSSAAFEEELRQRVLKERETDAEEALDRELEAESVKLDEEIEQEIQGARSPSREYSTYLTFSG